MDFRAYEAAPGISVIVLPDAPVFTYVAVSNDFLQITGLKKEAVIGKGLFDIFPKNPDAPQYTGEQTIRASLESIIRHKKPHEIAPQCFDMPDEKGAFSERYWKIRNVPILSDSGKVLYIILSATDSTEQVKAAQKVESTKGVEKAYTLFMNAPVFMTIIKGDEYIIDFANEGMLQVWGRKTEVIGKSLLQAVPELKGQGFIELLNQVRRTGSPYKAFESPVTLLRNGKQEVSYFDFIYQPYYENETDTIASGVMVVAYDVTVQVHSRQQLKNIVEQAPDPILILRGENLILEVANQALFELWQVGPEALNKPFLEILPEMKDQVFLGLLKNVLHTGKPHYGHEEPAVFKRKNGEYETRYVNFSYQPYREADGTITGVLVTATDVTGQVQAKQKLLESERNLRNTILQSPVAMCILKGPSFLVEVANNRMFELWGKLEEDVMNKPIFEGLPEVKDQGFEELLNTVFTKGETFTANEQPVTLPRGGTLEIVYVNFVYEPFREGDGAVSGVIVVAFDVSEQVRARKKVEESEQRVRSLVESAPFPIGVYVGREMRIELANQSIIEVWGKGPDVIGKCYSEVLPELENTGIYSQLNNVYTTGVPFHARNQRVDLVVDGKLQPFYFNYSFTPLHDTAGKIYGVMNTAADITDLIIARQKVEQSEQNFRNMVLQAPVAMCILLGPDHVVDVANEMMIQLWGKPTEEVMNKPIFEGLPDAREQGLEQLLSNVYYTGDVYTANEHPVKLLRNGKLEMVYQNFVYQPYKDADGNILGVLAISIDVTQQVLARQKIEEVVAQRTGELAKANEALIKSNQELKHLNTNLEEFAYAASHDMKEPIRKIHFFSDRLRSELKDQLNENQNRLFERLEYATRRMGKLIDDLLAYSQVTRGVVEWQEIDLNKEVQLVLEDLELEVQQKGGQVTVGPLPIIKGNPRQIQQLFHNLIGNALKYHKANTAPVIKIFSQIVKGKDIDIAIPMEEKDTDYHVLVVKDNGIGFEQKDAERIFNVFTRLHGNAEYRGTGVGLSIVRKVVENHKGYIRAESKLGEGATFYILLPFHQ